MFNGEIVLSSAGSLAVAVIAAFSALFHAWLYRRRPDEPWTGWGSALCLATIVFAGAVFIQYNTPAGNLNRFAECFQYTGILMLVHSLYGITFSMLRIPSKRYHQIMGAFHVFLVVVLWATKWIISDQFIYRDFVWLKNPYIEPTLGPAGLFFMVYAFLSICVAGVILFRAKDSEDKDYRNFNQLKYSLVFWTLLGLHDAVVTLGVPSVQFLMEYGFLGLCVGIVFVSLDSYIRLLETANESKAKLALERDRLEVTLRSIGDGVVASNRDGNVVLMNHVARELSGWSLKEAAGKPIHEVLRTMAANDTITLNESPILESSNENNDTSGNVILKTKTGKELVIARNQSPIQNSHGDVIGSVEVFRDITEQKRAEKALGKSRAKYQTVVNNVTEAILVAQEGLLRFVNPAGLELLGYPEEEILSKPVTIFIHEGDQELVLGRHHARIKGEDIPQTYSFRIVDKQGQEKTVEINAVTVTWEGKPATLNFLRDVTEERRIGAALRQAKTELEERVQKRTSDLNRLNEILQKEINARDQARSEMMSSKDDAERANRAKSDFLANMSHELRTPLNHIIGFTELILDKKIGELNDLQAEYLTDVHESSHHLLSLINDILDLSKVEAGKLSLETSNVNIRDLLENSLTMIKEKALKHGIQLSVHTNGIPETIDIDERKTKQIIYNLLSNAVKFTPDGGEIDLNARRVKVKDNGGNAKEHVEVSVRDTGIGLNQEDLGRIFEVFEQVESSKSRRFPGTGLGLPLTKKFVELHGGRIWAESEGDGKGSIFRFVIPT